MEGGFIEDVINDRPIRTYIIPRLVCSSFDKNIIKLKPMYKWDKLNALIWYLCHEEKDIMVVTVYSLPRIIEYDGEVLTINRRPW